MVNDHFCMALREVRSAQQAEITQFLQASIGSPKHSVRFTSGRTKPTDGMCSPATQVRVAVEAGAGEVIEDRARLLEFQIGP